MPCLTRSCQDLQLSNHAISSVYVKRFLSTLTWPDIHSAIKLVSTFDEHFFSTVSRSPICAGNRLFVLRQAPCISTAARKVSDRLFVATVRDVHGPNGSSEEWTVGYSCLFAIDSVDKKVFFLFEGGIPVVWVVLFEDNSFELSSLIKTIHEKINSNSKSIPWMPPPPSIIGWVTGHWTYIGSNYRFI